MPLGVVLAVLVLASGCAFDGAGSMSASGDEPGTGGADAAAEPGPDAATPTDDAGPVDGDDAGPSCPVYILEASRSYAPESRTDDRLDLGSPVALVVPAALPVIQGNAGDHCATLHLRRGGDELFCAYRGGSSQSTPSPGGQPWNEGLSYDFVGCVTDLDDLDGCDEVDGSEHRPGDAFEADRLELSVAEGAYSDADPATYDPTTVRVELEADCTVDGSGDGDGDD